MGFFRGHKRRGSFDLFSSYDHYVPRFGGVMALLAMLTVGVVLSNLANFILSLLMGEQFVNDYGMLISYPLLFIPALIFSSVMSRLKEYSTDAVPVDKGGFGIKGWLLLGPASVFATIAAAYVIEPINSLLPPIPEKLEMIFETLLHDCPTWVTLISVSVFAPLFEELLCRGLILRGLLKSNSPALAITLSALIFALIHINPWQAIPAFTIGLLLGYVYYKTGSLKLTMLMHCANNTMAVIFSNIPQFKDAETFMDILSPWAYWCIFAACIITVGCSVIVFRTYQQPLEKKA